MLLPNINKEINIKEILKSDLAILHSDGDLIWSEICNILWKDHLRQRTSVILNFKGITRVGFAFLNATIGRVLITNNMKANEDIKWKNIDEAFELEEKIQMVIENVSSKIKLNNIEFILKNNL